MQEKLRTQEVIDMATELFEDFGYSRLQVRHLLCVLISNGLWEAPGDTLERVFDMVVG